MKTKRKIILPLAVLLLASSALAQEEAAPAPAEAEQPQATTPAVRDPFQPFRAAPVSVSGASTEEGVEARKTLASYPLSAFRLVGIMRSPELHLAVVQTHDLKDYIVTTGDALGKEGGVVEEIRRDGITVKVGDEREDIPVSNKVEKVNEKAK